MGLFANGATRAGKGGWGFGESRGERGGEPVFGHEMQLGRVHVAKLEMVVVVCLLGGGGLAVGWGQ